MQISTIYLSSVEENIDFRYEPEFWLPKYIKQEKQLLQTETVSLADCVYFSNGSAFNSESSVLWAKYMFLK